MINVFGCEFEDINNIILFSIHFICKHHSLGSVRIIAINGDPPPLLGYGLYFGWIVTCKMYAILNSWKHTLNILPNRANAPVDCFVNYPYPVQNFVGNVFKTIMLGCPNNTWNFIFFFFFFFFLQNKSSLWCAGSLVWYT